MFVYFSITFYPVYTQYRVSQKYGTLHAAFELIRVVGLTNLEIVSNTILPTFFDIGKGPPALSKAPNRWAPDFFLFNHVLCGVPLNLSKQDKYFDT